MTVGVTLKQLLGQCLTDSHLHASLNLPLDHHGIDRSAAAVYGDETQHGDFTGPCVDLNIGKLCGVGVFFVMPTVPVFGVFCAGKRGVGFGGHNRKALHSLAFIRSLSD